MTATLAPPVAPTAEIATCRACGAGLEHTFVDLGMPPLSGRYLRADELHRTVPCSPLHVRVCTTCLLVQVPPPANAAPGGADASYSSACASTLARARAYTDKAIEELRLSSKHLVIEIGSNDGYLLQYFVARGVPVLGIDLAANVARVADARGVPTRVERFTEPAASALRDGGVQADLLIGNNVLEKVHDVNDFVAALKRLLSPRGVVTLDFPHLLPLVAETRFDAIRHERLSYFSLLAVTRLLAANGLTIYDVDEVDAHGGSLRVFACHSEDPLRPITPRIVALTARERAASVESPAYYAGFAQRVGDAKRALLAFLLEAKRGGKHIAGYGAHTKGNALLNYCGICTDFIDYTVDPDPEKHGRYLPGSQIPIHPPEVIEQTHPDYVLILPWHRQTEIVARLEGIRAWGGRCVVPLPTLRMVA